MDANEHVHDYIAAYVLGSLDARETAQVQEHLAACATCREEMRVYQLIVDDLSDMVPQVSPPEALKSRLVQSIEESSPRRMTSSPARPRFGLLQFLTGWRIPALAGVGLVLALAVSNILLWQQFNFLWSEHIETNMIIEPLRPVEEDSIATGIVVMDPVGDYGTVIVDSLPPASGDQKYQVWLSHDEVVDSGGIVIVHDNGYGAQVIYAPEPLLVYDRIWITFEPEGAGDEPTGTVVLQTKP